MQADRLRAQSIRDAKKAATAAKNAKRKLAKVQMKEGELCIHNFYFYLFFVQRWRLFLHHRSYLSRHYSQSTRAWLQLQTWPLGSTLRSLLPLVASSWNASPLLTGGLTEWERMTPGEILYVCPRRECALCRRLFSKVPCWRLARSLCSSGWKQNNARALHWEWRTKHWDSRILCSPETETRATAACPYIYMPRPSVPVSIL